MRYTKEQEQQIEIGERIRARRKELGMTQEVASEKCDVTNSFYGNIERGTRAMSIQTLIKICKGLGCSSDYILLGTDQSNVIMALELLKEQNLTEEDVDKFLQILDVMKKLLQQQ